MVRKPAAYAVAAVAALAAGSMAILLIPDFDSAAVTPAAVAVAVAAPPALVASAPAAPAAAPVAVAPAPIAAPAQPERDDFKNWSSDVAKLPKDLGEMGPSLKLGLDSARNNDMAFCFRELENGGNGTRATDFVLYLDAREDAIDVIDAKVARPGALPPSVVDCARDVLRGLEVKVFFAVPGHYSYIYEIEA
jgi:hypothetical protein